jgi:hypothetical protein
MAFGHEPNVVSFSACLWARPFSIVDRYTYQGGRLIDPLNPGHIYPRHAIQGLPWVERRSVAVAAPLATLGWQWLALALVGKRRQVARNADITGGELPMLELIAFQRLLQGKHMLGSPRALQGGSDSGLVVLAAVITQPRELRRVAFPGEDGQDDCQPGHARHVTHDVLQRDIHLRQRFLHMLDVARRIGQQCCPLPEITAQHDDLILRTETGGQQAVGVEALEPLAISTSVLGRPLRGIVLGSTSST